MWSDRVREVAGLVAAALLPACSEPTFRFRSAGPAMWQDVEVHFIVARDGTGLAYRDVGPIARAKHVLVFVPGSTMYGYYYVPFARSLAERGIPVRIVDLRGHGDSGGRRGDVPHEDALVDDLSSHLEHLRSRNREARLVVGGHSMGAGVCGRYLQRGGPAHGAVYIAPFFHYRQLGMKNPGYVTIHYLRALLGGDHVVTQAYHPTSADPKLVREYTKIMARASMVVDLGRFVATRRTRSLLVIGKRDELFDWEATLANFERGAVETRLIEDGDHLDTLIKSSRIVADWIGQL